MDTSIAQEALELTGATTAATIDTACNGDFLFEKSTQLLLGGSQQGAVTIEDWIGRYTRINVINNVYFTSQWPAYSEEGQSFESTIGQHSVKGNSRDDPTPWIYYCRKTVNYIYRAL